jgi:hypothetical protein
VPERAEDRPGARYSVRALPPYRYLPGRAPHPTRDPLGHSFGRHAHPQIDFDPARWSECEQYLYGIDLFNLRYWWEAHEALEAVWIAAGRTTMTGLFVQGLIQIAAAMLKTELGHASGAARLADEGLDKLALGGVRCLGIDVAALAAAVRSVLGTGCAQDLPRIELRFDRAARSANDA